MDITDYVIKITYFIFQKSLRSNDLIKDMSAHVRIDSREWVIEQVDVLILVYSASQTYSLLLASWQIHTLLIWS